MNRRRFVQGVGVAGLALMAGCGMLAPRAQEPATVARVGYLTAADFSAIPERTEAFRQGLRELGYVEGSTIIVEWRSVEGKFDRLPALAADLIGLKVDVIVSGGTLVTGVAKQTTSTIPIVMTQDNDPVGSGFIASLARPGGNITGLSTLAPDLSGKRLELLKAIVPGLSRVAVFGTSTSDANAQYVRETELAAGVLGVTLQYVDVLRGTDIEPAYRAAVEAHADAVLMNVAGALMSFQRGEIAELALKSRLPTIYDRPQYVEAGGLISYGVDLRDLDRRAATYVDKILKGTKPAELPVEQPMRFDFAINLRTARALGLTIPHHMLIQATEVIQ